VLNESMPEGSRDTGEIVVRPDSVHRSSSSTGVGVGSEIEPRLEVSIGERYPKAVVKSDDRRPWYR
jgi:hypothetical protein